MTQVDSDVHTANNDCYVAKYRILKKNALLIVRFLPQQPSLHISQIQMGWAFLPVLQLPSLEALLCQTCRTTAASTNYKATEVKAILPLLVSWLWPVRLSIFSLSLSLSLSCKKGYSIVVSVTSSSWLESLGWVKLCCSLLTFDFSCSKNVLLY